MPPDSLTAAALPLTVLRKRADFRAIAALNRKWVTGGFIIQTAPWAAPQFGLTASKKTGNAVLRNRARRRLRALAHEVLPQHLAPGHAVVLIARPEATATRDYAQMKKDLLWALKKLGVRRETAEG